MLTILIVAISSFSAVAIALWAILSAHRARAEAKMWQKKHNEVIDRENRAAWQANREMFMY
jgi:hypothetical protein